MLGRLSLTPQVNLQDKGKAIMMSKAFRDLIELEHSQTPTMLNLLRAESDDPYQYITNLALAYREFTPAQCDVVVKAFHYELDFIQREYPKLDSETHEDSDLRDWLLFDTASDCDCDWQDEHIDFSDLEEAPENRLTSGHHRLMPFIIVGTMDGYLP